jgi:hypothetical protein
MDVIHNDAKKGGKYGKVEGNIAPKINDYLWAMHEIWHCANPPPPLHWIDNHKRDKERKVMEEKTIWWILEKFLMGVVGKAERGPMYQERMKGLAEVN